MSDTEALIQFQKKPVNSEMVQYLVETTNSLIKIKPSRIYPSPPQSPSEHLSSAIPTLYEFIRRLIKHSNVQTPTLMSTLVYMARLKSILPSNVFGIDTTRHRIFLGCLILAAKNLNDSSPINKHWAAYTDGLLSIPEVNTIERELLEYLDWNLTITNQDLINSLSYFLQPIKHTLQKHAEQQFYQRQKLYISNASTSSTRLSNILSSSSKAVTPSSSISSVPSLMSSSSSRSTLSSINTSSNQSLNNYLRDPTILQESTKSLTFKSLNSQPSKSSLKQSLNLMNSGERMTQRVAC